MARVRGLAGVIAIAVTALSASAVSASAARIGFETAAVTDPIHAFGEPTVGIDPQARVFASGPTGTGTQRSVWLSSADGGHTFRVVTPGVPPNAIQGIVDPPGGGDTDIAFDRSGKQYFIDLYALACNRTATTSDAGATVFQSVYPAGCEGLPGSDRPWLAVYDPAPGTPNQSAYTGPRPLIYTEANNLNTGAQWGMSNSSIDPAPGGPGLNFVNAEQDGPSNVTNYSPVGADGYPAIDQVTGKVFQAAGQQQADKSWSVVLNIGTPNASGSLRFLDAPSLTHPSGDSSKLIHIADHLKGDPDLLFVVLSMDSARNLYVTWIPDDPTTTAPLQRQAFVSAASAASGWTRWSAPVQVSDASTATGDADNVFPWIQAGAPGRADAVWYGSNKVVDASSQSGQAWNVFMSQLVFPTDASGAVTGAPPSTQLVRVSPHPVHYNDICLLGSNCVTVQGNRNLADFFQVKADTTGAAEVIYDDTSNGLAQPGFTPSGNQTVDHSGAAVPTLARQSSGPGLFGGEVSGPSSAPATGQLDSTGDARYPVINGGNVPGMDLTFDGFSLSGGTLTATMKVVDLAHPTQTASAITGTQFLQYVMRWQFGNTLYYAAAERTRSGGTSYYAGKTQSVDLCSVSACDPHVLTYPEAGSGGKAESGAISCPRNPSASSPCTLTIRVHAADVGSPSRSSVLEEVGAYAFASSHQQGTTTNAQALADNVPLEIDGSCCFNFSGTATGGPRPASSAARATSRKINLSASPRLTVLGCRRFTFHATTRSGRRMVAVRGATVTFHGKKARTGRRGRVRIFACLGRARRYAATAKKRGYRNGRVTVRARRARGRDAPRFSG